MENENTEYRIKYILCLLIMFLMIIACSKSKKDISEEKRTNDQKEEITKESTTKPIEKEEISNWEYRESKDKMTDEKSYFATCKSINTVYFDFPYSGGSTFTLTLRKMNQNNHVLLRVSKGQFMASLFGSEQLRIKFDEGITQKYSYSSPSDGSSDVIFINNESNFISKLKKSKKILIEVLFFNHGKEIIEFNIEGLQWNR